MQQGPPPYLQNRYRLVRQLGAGGMGWVYRAHDELLGRDVAIKFLTPARMADAQSQARFSREAHSLAKLSHPHIVTLFDAGQEASWHYLILEYVVGQNLHQVRQAQNGRLSLTTTLTFTRQLLQALDYAHQQGLIHRDIKPENVMVDEHGRVRLTDFGLARLLTGSRITREPAMMGTMLYLAPETIQGNIADHRVDLYAVGAMMFEMLVGSPPFTSSSPARLLAKIINDSTPPLPDIPAAVEMIIVRLLEKEPSARFQSAQEVLAALPTSQTAQSLPGRKPAPTDASLVEQLIRTSSAIELAETVTPDLLRAAALADTTTAVEAERRRLATLLQEHIVEPLDLLLAQSQLYEQSFTGHPQTRMALSVLTSLVRQTIQQAQDLTAALQPDLLENLGLEPALDDLVNRQMRRYGVIINLQSPRLEKRLPMPFELALYRLSQMLLHLAITTRKATQFNIQLQVDSTQIAYKLEDNGLLSPDLKTAETAVARIQQLGGQTTHHTDENGSLTFRVILPNPAHIQLTPREKDVLQLVAAGLTNKAIAQQLHISPRTVNFHLDNIFSKFGVKSRTEAAVFALRLHLLPADPV